MHAGDASDLVAGLFVFTQMGHGYDMYDSYQRSISIPNIAKQGSKNKLPPPKKGAISIQIQLFSVRCRCGAQEQAERHDTDSTCATGLQLRVETYLQESLSFPGFLSWRVTWYLNQRRCCLMFLEESSSLGDSVYTYTMQCNIYIYVYILYTDYRIRICRHIGMLFPPSSRTRKEQGKTRNEQGMNKERERNEQETTRKEQWMIKERTRNEQDRTHKEQERTRKEQGKRKAWTRQNTQRTRND